MFVEFKCTIEELRYGMWSEANYFVFVTNGKKMWKTHQNEFVVEAGDALFVKKGANIAYQFHSEDYCALMIFIPDSFIKDFLINKHVALHNTSLAKPKKHIEDGVYRVPVDPFLVSYINSLEVFFSQSFDPDINLLKFKFEELLLNIFSIPKYKEIASHMLRLNLDHLTQLEIVMN